MRFATVAASVGSGDSKLRSTSRLLRIGETVTWLRNRSIALDCALVSSGDGGSTRLADDRVSEGNADVNTPRSPDASEVPANCGCCQSCAASRVRRAKARLWRIRYCV